MVQSLYRVGVITRAVVWVVLQGVGTLMVARSVAVGRAQLCGMVREGMVRDGAVIRQRCVDDDGLVERAERAWCMPRREKTRGTGGPERVSFFEFVHKVSIFELSVSWGLGQNNKLPRRLQL